MPKTDDIGFLIKLIHTDIGRLCARMMGPTGLTQAQCDVVEYFIEHSGEKVLVKNLVDHLQLDQSTVSGILKRMMNKGLISLSQDPMDGRQRLVSLSPQTADELQQNALAGTRSIEELITQGLSPQDVMELKRLLNIVYRNLHFQNQE